jgi:hypothetical protein
MVFNQVNDETLRTGPRAAEYQALQQQFEQTAAARREAAVAVARADSAGDPATRASADEAFKAREGELRTQRADAIAFVREATGDGSFNDVNYVFPSSITTYMPIGLAGLLIAAIFAAAMSTISAEMASLSTASVIDFYRRFVRHEATDRIESQWNGGTGMAIGRFLAASNQRRGTIVLSTALGGEGRTLNVGRGDNIMAVTFPLSGEDPREAFFVAAHEAVGTVSNQVVRDNSSAADERSGESARWSSLAAVRGGALMLERVAPELADGYRRYYLRLARQPVNGDIVQRFASTFSIPDPIRVALERQIALILGGI